jgi:hypothetical protein
MAVSLALFAVLHFSLTFLFARAATARFPDADRLAGFLGVFMGATSGTASHCRSSTWGVSQC